PVTRAHVVLADAARAVVDEVVAVLPRAYPHKELHGASIEDRVRMLQLAGLDRVEVTNGGLFVEIARELRKPDTELYFICGRAAAERVLTWNYGDPGAARRMLDEFQLLVAAREGEFNPPLEFCERVHRLAINASLDHISSTEVRRRIAAGEPWR